MKTVEFKDLKKNKRYKLHSKQFNVDMEVVCLGNYGVGEKVYLSRCDKHFKAETPTSLAAKFKRNILPNSFVCWEHDVNNTYILNEL